MLAGAPWGHHPCSMWAVGSLGPSLLRGSLGPHAFRMIRPGFLQSRCRSLRTEWTSGLAKLEWLCLVVLLVGRAKQDGVSGSLLLRGLGTWSCWSKACCPRV